MPRIDARLLIRRGARALGTARQSESSLELLCNRDCRTCAGKERAPIRGEYIAECVPPLVRRPNLICDPLPSARRTATVKLMHLFRRLACVRAAAAVVLLAASGCARGQEYELRGQVLAVDEGRQEVTIKHEDIRGFMPGMTMPFKVRPAALLRGRHPGELIRATLVVQDRDAYLKSIESTGHAPLAEPPPAPRVDLLRPGDEVKDAAFVDETGTRRALADWRGQTVALTFIYTRCPVPTFCPLMDRQFAEVQRSVLNDERLRGRVHLLSISFDPAFDTPPVLAAHAKTLGADGSVWTFVTGERAALEAVGAPLGVSIMPDRESPQEIVHNLRTAVIDGNGRLVKIFSGNEWTAAELVSELRAESGRR